MLSQSRNPDGFLWLVPIPKQLSGIYSRGLSDPPPPTPSKLNTFNIWGQSTLGALVSSLKITFYLSVNLCSTKVLIKCTFCSFPNGDGAAILRGHLSHAKVQPFAGWRQHLRFSVILIPWVSVRYNLRSGGPFSLLFGRLGSVLWIEPSTSWSSVKRSPTELILTQFFCSSISQPDGVRVGRVKGMAVPSTKLLQKVLYSMLWLQIQKIFSCFKVACGHSRLASLPPPSRLCSQASFSAEQTFFFSYFSCRLEKLRWPSNRVRSQFDEYEFNERSPLPSEFQQNWLSRVHFAVFPVSTLGNWIPRVLSQWYCSGHNCGLDQIVVEDEQGN